MAIGFSSGPDEDPILGDINVTPLVDVMLVLLIIFMVTAPMLHQGVEVALPRAKAERLKLKARNPLVITVKRDGIVYVDKTPIHPSQLQDRLVPLLKARNQHGVLLKGDRSLAYGDMMHVLDILHRGGIEDIGLVTESPPGHR